jgi:hypothetical protein
MRLTESTASLKLLTRRFKGSQGSAGDRSSFGAAGIVPAQAASKASAAALASVTNRLLHKSRVFTRHCFRFLLFALSNRSYSNRISADRATALHLLQLFFGHEIAHEIDAGFESNSLNLLEIGYLQSTAQEIYATNQVADHEAIFCHVVVCLGDLARLNGSSRDQADLLWRGRRIIQQIQQDPVRLLGRAELQQGFRVMNC